MKAVVIISFRVRENPAFLLNVYTKKTCRLCFCSYNKDMQISFDPAKDAANLAKHGVSLALAAELEWDAAMTWTDARRNYGEVREVALVPLASRLYFVAYTDRAAARRIISLRKANAREVKHYADQN